MKKNIPGYTRQLFFVTFYCFLFLQSKAALKPGKELYELTVYHYNDAVQENVLDNYLEKALLPALHRAGIQRIGVFKSLANDTVADKKIYVLVPVQRLAFITIIPLKLNADTAFQSAGADYLQAAYTAPAYSRKEVILLEAFPLAAQMKLPLLQAPKSERVYELRSYESASEKIFANKVKMFNEGDEIGLFSRLHFNAVFYSSVIAGSKMPNLMYMTCFENMTDRDQHWKNFVADPYWKKLSAMPEYQHNISHMDITFLRPVNYSDF